MKEEELSQETKNVISELPEKVFTRALEILRKAGLIK